MKREINQPERLLTIKEVAKIQQTCERTVRRRIASGELPALRDGRLIRVRARDLSVYQMQRLIGRGNRLRFVSSEIEVMNAILLHDVGDAELPDFGGPRKLPVTTGLCFAMGLLRGRDSAAGLRGFSPTDTCG